MKILVTGDDHDTLKRAAEYTSLFASNASITLMLSARQPSRRKATNLRLDGLAEWLRQKTSGPVDVILRQGRILGEILSQVGTTGYDLTVVGIHLQRRLDRLRPKATARELAGRIDSPLLVVLPAWERLDRILVWSAGEEPDDFALQLVGRIAAETGAEVMVLHVMSQIALAADADLEDLERSAQDLIAHETYEGRLLERALDILHQHGLPPERCEVKVRHGLTVVEIIDESEEGDFDLVAVGALETPSRGPRNDFKELLQENLATRVLMESSRPVLITRRPQGGVDWRGL